MQGGNCVKIDFIPTKIDFRYSVHGIHLRQLGFPRAITHVKFFVSWSSELADID